MAKLTLQQKKRETLRRQLYGREVTTPKTATATSVKNSQESVAIAKTFSLADYEPHTSNEVLTTNYLAHDLTKILIFSVVAIGVQFTLFFLLQNNLVKLPL